MEFDVVCAAKLTAPAVLFLSWCALRRYP
jgi:hypothetical protein